MKKITTYIAILALLMCCSSTAEPKNHQSVKYSKRELELLARVVEAEARGECFYGKYLVASTVINRVTDSRFPQSIAKVVRWPRQYAKPRPKYSTESMEAVQKAIIEPYPEILYFYNPNTATDVDFISRLQYCIDVGNHRFCSDLTSR